MYLCIENYNCVSLFQNIKGMLTFYCSPEICAKGGLSGLGAGNHG